MTDKEFLSWVADRLVHVYGESESVDFVHKLRKISQRTWVGLSTTDWNEIKKQVSYNFEMTTGEYAERVSHLVEEKLMELNT